MCKTIYHAIYMPKFHVKYGAKHTLNFKWCYSFLQKYKSMEALTLFNSEYCTSEI